MKVKLFLSVVCSFFISTLMMAQEQGVPFNGIVRDVAGRPLKKVKISAGTSSSYTYSNKKGQFGLTNVAVDDTLHLKYKKVHYDIPVDGKRSMVIKLADQLEYEVREDSELIDLGFTFVKRREYLSPHNSLSGEELVKQGFNSITEAIIAKVPGVTMYGGVLTIRGISSINLSNEPLYVVDGVTCANLNMVSLYDVDKIEVLKDGSWYGIRGANGVIVVTTKRGPSK